ncbi:MAG TPA: 30S ribosomal protein S13, partial [Acidimicrobiales bacterium]|nr:30S ribosomal protein S13 [Acidimicrobiales bacterium]
MARISGIDIPRDKQVQISLTYIHGVGRTRALEVCEGAGIDPISRVRDLTDEEVTSIRAFIEEHLKVEGDLRRE